LAVGYTVPPIPFLTNSLIRVPERGHGRASDTPSPQARNTRLIYLNAGTHAPLTLHNRSAESGLPSCAIRLLLGRFPPGGPPFALMQDRQREHLLDLSQCRYTRASYAALEACGACTLPVYPPSAPIGRLRGRLLPARSRLLPSDGTRAWFISMPPPLADTYAFSWSGDPPLAGGSGHALLPPSVPLCWRFSATTTSGADYRPSNWCKTGRGQQFLTPRCRWR